MKAENINGFQTNFNAKVSPRFIKSMQGYFNNGPNRLHNNYRLNQKITEYESFGRDDFTIEMRQKSGALGYEYSLVAVRDGDKSDRDIVLAIRTSYRKIVNKFMNMNKGEFYSHFRGIKK